MAMVGLIEGKDGDLAVQDYLNNCLEDDTIYITKSRVINEFYGTDCEEDLKIVSLKYNKLRKLLFIRLEIGARWFDDFIDSLKDNEI